MTLADELAQDDDIDCPLFQRLQLFFREEARSENEARIRARRFMREFWLPSSQQSPQEKAE
jgi:hypothetical protein